MKKWLMTAFLALLSVNLTGCFRMERPHVTKDLYTLNASRIPSKAVSDATGHLRITRMTVSPAYDMQEFVYRKDAFQMDMDYYHRFIRQPGALVTEETARWLADSGLFESVSSIASERRPDFVLEGHLSELCGDFQMKDAPRAIFEVRVRLLNRRRVGPDLLLNRVYRQVVPLPNSTPTALAAGWNLALEEYLTQLEADLAGVIQKKKLN